MLERRYGFIKRFCKARAMLVFAVVLFILLCILVLYERTSEKNTKNNIEDILVVDDNSSVVTVSLWYGTTINCQENISTNVVEAGENDTTQADQDSSYDLGTDNKEQLEENATVDNAQALEPNKEESTELTAHTHNYVMTSSCRYYPEEGHYEQVCVLEGYTEYVYEDYDMYCYYCGAVMDDWGFDQVLEHSSIHGAYGTYQKVVDSIWHEPVYENVWIVDVEEFYEEEMVVECIDCGYIETSKFYGD